MRCQYSHNTDAGGRTPTANSGTAPLLRCFALSLFAFAGLALARGAFMYSPRPCIPAAPRPCPTQQPAKGSMQSYCGAAPIGGLVSALESSRVGQFALDLAEGCKWAKMTYQDRRPFPVPSPHLPPRVHSGQIKWLRTHHRRAHRYQFPRTGTG